MSINETVREFLDYLEDKDREVLHHVQLVQVPMTDDEPTGSGGVSETVSMIPGFTCLSSSG